MTEASTPDEPVYAAPPPAPDALAIPDPAAPPAMAAGWMPDPSQPGMVRYWDGTAWTNHVQPAQGQMVPAQPRSMVVSGKENKGGQAVIAWVIAVLTLGYMLPWAIAASRGKSNAGAIGLLNFLLGWTAVGWIIALVMACGAHDKVAVNY